MSSFKTMVVLSSIKIDINVWSLKEARQFLKEIGLSCKSPSYNNDIVHYDQRDVEVLELKGYTLDSEQKILEGIHAVFHLNQDNDENEESKRQIIARIKSGEKPARTRQQSPSRTSRPRVQSPKRERAQSPKRPLSPARPKVVPKKAAPKKAAIKKHNNHQYESESDGNLTP